VFKLLELLGDLANPLAVVAAAAAAALNRRPAADPWEATFCCCCSIAWLNVLSGNPSDHRVHRHALSLLWHTQFFAEGSKVATLRVAGEAAHYPTGYGYQRAFFNMH
jgi:hypothetical protein